MIASESRESRWHSTRYRVLQEIGRGGMGVVYRAYDRLSRREVALKRIEHHDAQQGRREVSGSAATEALSHAGAPPQLSHRRTLASPSSGNLSEGDHQRIALAREYRILASLRHPYIISVLDYGFDEVGRSYLVMELLSNASNLLDICEQLPLAARIELIRQLIQALRYLHRAGVVHRDLKPDNVLVVDIDGVPTVKVVDFGLALRSRHDEMEGKPAGTVAYMAPEVLLGAAPSELSDLYALGVLAYQVCTGWHPFQHLSPDEMVVSARYGLAELGVLPLEDGAQRLIGALMSPKPSRRPSDADQVLVRWCTANGIQPPNEPAAIRDSFLRGARFIGRERELRRLTEALDDASAARGSAWLIRGMSGVGKSRLIDEVKAAAQVRGMLVLTGQAAGNGRQGFALWRDVLREAALYAPLTPLQCSVLWGLIDDLDELIEAPIDPAPQLDQDGNLRRLARVVEQLFDQLHMPTLVILNDIQWATQESAALLARLMARSTSRRSLVVASLRDDDVPRWIDSLQGAQELVLAPFSTTEVRAMLEAMVGAHPISEQVFDALMGSSEGNPFFLAELLRGFADAQGSLSGALNGRDFVEPPSQQQLLARTLDRVPPWAREALEFAAIAGRQIDLTLMASECDDVMRWLHACAAENVLEVADDRWRFRHEKLREQVMARLPAERLRALHRRVADALQALTPANGNAAEIAYHLRAAGDMRAALPLLASAAELALRQGAASEAARLAEQVLDAEAQHAVVWADRVRARFVMADASFALGRNAVVVAQVHELLLELGLATRTRSRGAVRLRAWQQLLALPRRAPLPRLEQRHDERSWRLVLAAVRICYRVHGLAGESEQGLQLLLLAYNLSRALGLDDKAASCRCGFAYALSMTPARSLARPLLAEAAGVIEQRGDDHSMLLLQEARGLIAINIGRWRSAERHFGALATLARALGDERRELFAALQTSLALHARGELRAAQAQIDAAEVELRLGADHQLRAILLNRRGWLALHRGEIDRAIGFFESALAGADLRLVTIAVRSGLSLALWLADHKQHAQTHALAVVADLQRQRLSGHAGLFAVPAVAEVLLAARREALSPQADRYAEAALIELRRYRRRFPMGTPSQLRLSAQEHHRRGQQKQAERSLARAIVAADGFGMEVERHLATLQLAAISAADNSAADSALQKRARDARDDLVRRGAHGCLRLFDRQME